MFHIIQNLKSVSLREHRLLLAILLCAMGLRLAFIVFYPPEKTWSDSGGYHLLAVNLLQGNGYSQDVEPPYAPTRVRPPAYPVFLAAVYAVFGVHSRAAVLVQAFLGTVTVFLLYLLGSRIFNRRAGLLAAVLAATYPALVYYDTRILREGFTALLVTASVTAAVYFNSRPSRRKALAIGALLAVVSMCRPETLLLSGPVLYLMVRPVRFLRPVLKSALLVALPLFLVWAPWTARNYLLFGTLSPTADGIGSVLWFGSRWAEIGGEDRSRQDYRTLREKTLSIKDGAPETQNEQRFLNRALQDITQKPGWYISLVFKKMYLFWKDANGVRKTLPSVHPALALLVNGYYYLLLAMVPAGLILSRGKNWTGPLVATVLFYMCIYALLHVRNRYRVPVMPLILTLSAGGFGLIRDLIHQRVSGKSHAPIPWPESPKNGVFSHSRVKEGEGS